MPTCTAFQKTKRMLSALKASWKHRIFLWKRGLMQQHVHSPGIWFELEHVNFSCPNTPCLYISGKQWRLEVSCRRTNEVILLHPYKNTLSGKWENTALHCREWIANTWQPKVKIRWRNTLGSSFISLIFMPSYVIKYDVALSVWEGVFEVSCVNLITVDTY